VACGIGEDLVNDLGRERAVPGDVGGPARFRVDQRIDRQHGAGSTASAPRRAGIAATSATTGSTAPPASFDRMFESSHAPPTICRGIRVDRVEIRSLRRGR
jgi:hypothetical protein